MWLHVEIAELCISLLVMHPVVPFIISLINLLLVRSLQWDLKEHV